MSKVTKIRFNRDSKLNAKTVHNDNVISTITYEKGMIDIISDGFMTRINNVDELVVVMKPHDPYITELAFIAENYEGGKNKLDLKMIGILNEHIKMECENEIREEEKSGKRGRPPKNKSGLVRKADIPD